MTRRLALALLLFTAVLLLVAEIPLGVIVSSRDIRDYATATRELGQSLASLAEDSFDDTPKPVSTARLMSAAGAGVFAEVLDLRGHVVVASTNRPAAPAAAINRAMRGETVTLRANDAFVAAVPVLADGQQRGVVVLSRSDEAAEQRIERLWLSLGLVAGVAMLVALALAMAAARWVGRPLRRLTDTAHGWSEGSLHGRADTAAGPPEVRQVAAALNMMAERLDVLLNSSRAVVADVSHQLRTPLAGLRLRLELIREELAAASTGPALDDVDVMLAEVERLSALVDGLLAVARAESGTTAAVAIDVASVVRERVAAWEPVAAERAAHFEFQEGGSVVAAATSGHLEQVLDNVFDNALEAMPDGGTVSVAVRREGGFALIDVVDSGRGMSAELQDTAFRRFASGASGQRTGLGLAIVHRLVTSDGGRVDLRSSPGQGTQISIRLPLARRDDLKADVKADAPTRRPHEPATPAAVTAEDRPEPRRT